MKYGKLPSPARSALWEYFRSGGTDPRRLQWGYAEVPLASVAQEMWRTSPDMRADFKSFEDYHRWFVRSHRKPDWTRTDPDSVLALILKGPVGGPYEEDDFGKIYVIEDGYHRFHWYWQRFGPSFRVPVVWVLA